MISNVTKRSVAPGKKPLAAKVTPLRIQQRAVVDKKEPQKSPSVTSEDSTSSGKAERAAMKDEMERMKISFKEQIEMTVAYKQEVERLAGDNYQLQLELASKGSRSSRSSASIAVESTKKPMNIPNTVFDVAFLNAVNLRKAQDINNAKLQQQEENVAVLQKESQVEADLRYALQIQGAERAEDERKGAVKQHRLKIQAAGKTIAPRPFTTVRQTEVQEHETPVAPKPFTPARQTVVQEPELPGSPSGSSEGSSGEASEISSIGEFDAEMMYMPKSERKNDAASKKYKLKYSLEDNIFRRMSLDNRSRGDKLLRITSDKYLDIQWSDASVNGYLTFLQNVEQFSLKHQQPIKDLLPLVEERLMETVMNEIQLHFPSEFRTRRDMLEISVEHLTAVVQLMLVPKSRQHFLILLKHSCKDLMVEHGNESYKSVKSKLCGLRTKFLDRYDFLREACELSNHRKCIPHNTFKDGGVLWTWLDLTPSRARHNFKLELSHKTWDDLRGFLKDFFKIVDKTARQAESALAYEYTTGIRGKSVSTQAHPNQYLQRSVGEQREQREQRDLNNSRRTSSGYSGNVRSAELSNRPFVARTLDNSQRTQGDQTRRVGFVSNGKRLNFVDEDEVVDDLDDYTQWQPDEWDVDVSQQQAAAAADDEVDFTTQYEEAFAVDKRDDRLPCHKMLFNESCSNGDRCKFSHDRGVLDAEWNRISERRKQVQHSAQQGPSTRPGQTLADVSPRKEVPGFQQPHRFEKGKVSEIRILKRGESMVGMVSDLFQTVDKPVSWKAAHYEAAVSTDEVTFFTVGAALFDSGASADNYISSGTVEEFHLQSHVQTDSTHVKVADGRLVHIQGIIWLLIKFVDPEGSPVQAKLLFRVLEGLSVPTVLGIKAILTHFKRLFISMLDGTPKCNQIDSRLTDSEMDAVGRQTSQHPIQRDDGLAVEELLIPDPNSFPCSDNLGIVTVSQLEQEFHEQVVSRVSTEYAQVPGAMDFLHCNTTVRVYVANNWSGINGIEPLELEFRDDLPKFIKPKARKIPPKLLEATELEFNRMLGYFYAKSTSPIASPLVVAPKNSIPWIRICGDYRVINKYIVGNQYYIPDVLNEIQRALGFKVYCDLDVKNAFHQIWLAWRTSLLLSVQTAWGLFRPLLLPEGVTPASMALMQVMYDMFKDFMEWTIVIFDNILILAHDAADCAFKVQLVIQR